MTMSLDIRVLSRIARWGNSITACLDITERDLPVSGQRGDQLRRAPYSRRQQSPTRISGLATACPTRQVDVYMPRISSVTQPGLGIHDARHAFTPALGNGGLWKIPYELDLGRRDRTATRANRWSLHITRLGR